MTDGVPLIAGEPAEPSDVERAENVKHLDLIQAVISRLAGNSFYIKGWTLTLAAAAFGIAVNRIDWKIAVAGWLVVLGFWLLDAYYLRQERLFRHLYNHVRRNISTNSQDRFSMNLLPFVAFKTVDRMRVFLSVTLLVFYPILMIAGIFVTVISAFASSGDVQFPR